MTIFCRGALNLKLRRWLGSYDVCAIWLANKSFVMHLIKMHTARFTASLFYSKIFFKSSCNEDNLHVGVFSSPGIGMRCQFHVLQKFSLQYKCSTSTTGCKFCSGVSLTLQTKPCMRTSTFCLKELRYDPPPPLQPFWCKFCM